MEKARRKKPARWSHSVLLSEMEAVRHWGGARLPSEYGLCKPQDDMPYILAAYETAQLIEFVEAYLAEEEAKKREKQKGK